MLTSDQALPKKRYARNNQINGSIKTYYRDAQEMSEPMRDSSNAAQKSAKLNKLIYIDKINKRHQRSS